MFLLPFCKWWSTTPKNLLLSLERQPHGGPEARISHKGVQTKRAPISVSAEIGVACLLADDVDAVFCESHRPPWVATPTASLYLVVCGAGVPTPLRSAAMLQDVSNSPVHLCITNIKTNPKEFFGLSAQSITKVSVKEEGIMQSRR